jgi:FtsP/CotA-like multicopper oxidase with cupredoxin domain
MAEVRRRYDNRRGKTLTVPVNAGVSRRSLLLAAAGAAVTVSWGARSASAETAMETRLTAASARASLSGAGQPETKVWAYNGAIPGPVLRLKQGEPARIAIENGLSEETTVHWHGMRVPNPMDGVPGLTQRPIKPGESFLYEFTPPDAGTFWYHSHANGLEQLGRGLAGPIVVEERTPVAVDRDLLWFLSDWRLTEDGEIASGFGGMMDAGMSGRVGNFVTLNGLGDFTQPVKARERIRLRLVNGAVARIMRLRFEGHHPVVVALDGQPCEPHEPEDGRILLGPAMRADIVLDMLGAPGRHYAVIDDFYNGLSYRLTEIAYDEQPSLRTQGSDAQIVLPRNPLTEPDLAAAERHELVLQGGMMGGGAMAGLGGMDGMMGGMGGMMGSDKGTGGMMGMGRMVGVGGGAVWAVNGASMIGDGSADMKPALTFQRGRSVVLTLRNQTAWWHPMHFHGHSFRVLTRNGAAVPYRQWRDTVLLAPKDTVEIAFLADNPGDWMLHCHVMDHQVSGLMTVLRVA